MQTKYSQKEYRLDILRVSERKLSEEVMQKRNKTIAGEKTPVKESLGSKELAAEQDAMGNRRGRSSTKQSPTVLVDDDDDHEDTGFQPSPVATKEGLDNTVDKASEEDMDGEFGKGEGSRNYFILKNVQNQERLQQIKWFLERVMLLVKLDYISRENYATLSWAEKGRRFGWATMLYERIHSEIFSKEKKRVQRSTKVGPLITAIYMHVRNNAVLRALNPSGSHQAADRHEEDIQEGCSQPTGVRKAAQEAKQKMLDQQEGAAEIYRSLLSAGYSHEECMETVGLDKSVELPKFWGETSVPTREFKTPITVSTVKKPIRLRKRKVESVVGQEPELTQQGQDTGPVQVFQDISFARVLEASSLIKEYMEQQHLNNAVLVNGNSKLKAENEELKKNLETNLLNRAEIEGLQEQIRLLTAKLQAKEEKLDFYQKQLSRRVSTAQMYKKWQEEWSAILNKEFDMLFATNARLEADNKVLLNRVTACKEVEEKIRDCTDEELVIDGWYLPAQEVDDMKAELRRQGEQIWMNFGKKMEEVISKPYQIFAKEENSEELLLLQSQLEDLQGKFNFLQEQQSEKEHKKADDSQVDEEFNVKGKRSAVEKFCFDEEPVQQTGEEYESSDLHTLISKIAGDLEKPVKSLEILSDVVITSENVDDKEQDEKQDDVVKEKDELLVDVQNIKEQETVAEQQQDVVMEAVGDVQAIQDVVLYEAEKKDADEQGIGVQVPKKFLFGATGKLSESCQKLSDQGVIRLDQEVFRSVYKWEMIGTKEKVDAEPEKAPPGLNKQNVKLRRISDMTRVNTDNTFMGLYKHKGGEHPLYYRCEEPILTELIDQKRLYVFSYVENRKVDLLMADKYARIYVNVDQRELKGYTYYGEPLPNYYFTPLSPEPLVKLIESMEYPVYLEIRPMGSLRSQVPLTTHMGSGTYFSSSHARGPMNYGERGVDE
ncbi:hypothetical protein L7F22_034777 [Adiantum nelumboides]|nr:hypothetical protein [Adiantum nelumboides]